MNAQVPAVEAAEEKLKAAQAEARRCELAAQEEYNKAAAIRSEWNVRFAEYEKLYDRLRYAKQQAEIMDEYASKYRAEIIARTGVYDCSKDMFNAFKHPHLEGGPMFDAYGRENHFLWFGMRLAAAESAADAIKKCIPGFREAAATAYSSLLEFAKTHDIKHDVKCDLT